jgi:hypothetical protein
MVSWARASRRIQRLPRVAELLERGVEVSEVQKFDWGSFVFFSDPDGNGWSVQQANPRE